MNAKRMSKLLKRLRSDTSGNALMLVAMGMPMLIGGAGLGVDISQWYMLKRELQFAADQSALAGAWASANVDSAATFQLRAQQEFAGNLSTTQSYSPTTTVAIADYDGGSGNSVIVTAALNASLPFSSFITGNGASISVRAQASFERTEEFDPCLRALHPTASQSVWFHGGPTVVGACGVGALSTAEDAIKVGGNSGTFDIGYAATAGGVDDGHNTFGNAPIAENLKGLDDPYSELTPPDNSTARSLSCPTDSPNYASLKTVTRSIVYDYFIGANQNKATPYDHPNPTPGSSTPTSEQTSTDFYPADTEVSQEFWTQKGGKNANKIFERRTEIVTTTYSDIVDNNPVKTMQPGTYENFEISCDTALAGGVYVLNGGQFKLNGNHTLTGNGVMFVLKNGASLQITGGSNVSLTPMNATEVTAATGLTGASAEALAGMLIFEDPNSSGDTVHKINGNAGLALEGVVYLPNNTISILGNMGGVSECLVIAASVIEIGGSANLTNLCPPGKVPNNPISNANTRVRLVS